MEQPEDIEELKRQLKEVYKEREQLHNKLLSNPKYRELVRLKILLHNQEKLGLNQTFNEN
jgi:flagellar biosynthesis chaperone FliJ